MIRVPRPMNVRTPRAGVLRVKTARLVALGGFAALLLGACVRASARTDVLSCTAADSVAAGVVVGDSLAGDFRLRMIATRGSRAGASAEGTLALRPFAAPGRPDYMPATPYATRFPVHGSTSVVPDSVGATAPGSLTSTDATRPGVLMLYGPDGVDPEPSVRLRFGSESNRTDLLAFDGAFFVLTVRSARSDRFGGVWESAVSGVPAPRAGGFFCAERGD